ncbi:thiosulfate oxidation carrier complex protein SoxZ [Paenalcaligenes niemegkensis]|uniref:thiosulfate oxidation carrier complex protein SoxZ n=1 Tax=Paenalcaligenes niemegkensis TaxID=2895469 RepID=UPI001EE83B67|nr:thiosulfate oxidation carrier complex protein SoxZ [Paenalcaligenes niemegkensis]MCQ9616145.1 thiosulfate oxidation carrier complex protein SoxZ [Paenalcaligenes niemegkensis]
MSKPRIWISNASPKAGEVVRVRALIEHRMESGLRQGQDGKEIPRNIINEFEARLDGELLFSWEPETAISQNPYIEFTFVAQKPGELQMKWVDDEGTVITGSQALTAAP